MSGGVQALIGSFNPGYLPPLPPPVVPDDFDFLIHFDSVDGSNRFVEEGGKQVDNFGTTVLETSTKKFGAGSGGFTDGYCRVFVSSFGLKDFTLCAWFYWDGADTGSDIGLFAAGPIAIKLDRSNSYALTLRTGSVNVIAGIGGAFTANAWHFVCLERAAGLGVLTLDGTTVGTYPARISYFPNIVFMGLLDGLSPAFNGFIDDAMLQIGAAYFGGGDFSVPTGAFTVPGAAPPSPAPSPSPSPAPAVRTPGAGAIVLTRYVPDFAVTGPQARTPGAGAVTIAGFVPGAEVSNSSDNTDTYFANVVLLLHGNGPDASTSAGDFIDSSEANHSAALGSNVSLTITDKKYGSAAISFAGTSTTDRLQYYQTGSEFTMGTQDFTWEGWIKPSLLSGLRIIIGSRETVDAGPLIFTTGTALRAFTFDGLGNVFGDITGGTLNTSAWHHWAYVRSGTSFKLFLDGNSVGTPVTSSTSSPNTASLILGVDTSTGGREYQGLMDDVRITLGVARYSSNFTPPTDQFADAGPASPISITPGAGSLVVTGQIPAFSSQGSVTRTPAAGSIAITGVAPTFSTAGDTAITPSAGSVALTGQAPAFVATGNASIAPTAGAASYTGYSPSLGINGNFEVLLHLDGTNGSTTFIEEGGKTVTLTSTVALDTSTKKFGSASANFTGGYLSVPISTLSSDFTACAWFYWGGSGSNNGIISFGSLDWEIFIRPASGNVLALWNGSSNTIIGSTAVSASTWHFVALERVGSTITLTLDGAVEGTTSNGSSLGFTTLIVGAEFGGSEAFQGHIDEVMLQNGSAYFGGSSFTPPTAAFAVANNTSITPSAGSVAIAGQAPTFSVFAPLPLDSYKTDMLGSYALKRLHGAYAGSCLRIQRSSDSTEQDIGFSGNTIDLTALASFVGGSNGLVTKWYDQSGDGNDLIPVGGAATLPMLVSGGSYLGQLDFGSNAMLKTTNTTNTTGYTFVTQCSLDADVPSIILSTGAPPSDTNSISWFNDSGAISTFIPSGTGSYSIRSYTTSDRADKVRAARYDRTQVTASAQSDFFVSGTKQSETSSSSSGTFPTGAIASSPVYIGAYWNGSTTQYSGNLNMVALAGYDAPLSDSDVTAISAIVLTGSNTTITPAAGSATLAGYAPVRSVDIPGDAYYAYRVLGLHFEGGSIVDSSPVARTITTNGANQSTSGPKFGSKCLNSTANSQNIYAANSTDFDFGSGAYTVCGFAKNDSSGSRRFLISNRSESGSDDGWYISILADGSLNAAAKNANSTAFDIGGGTPSTSTYFHYALTCDGSTIRLFVDGTSVASTAAVTLSASTGRLWVNSSGGEDGTRDWIGQQDEVYVYKGACLWTANFTPPAAPFLDNAPRSDTSITPNAGSAGITGYAPAIGGSVGLLDGLTANLWGAYGLSRLIGSYSGPVAKVRRSSDNATLDIGFSGDTIDVAAITSFASSGHAYFHTWYDQSGGGNNFVQTNVANQAIIYFSGSYLGHLQFDGGDDGMVSANASGTPAAITVFGDMALRDLNATYVLLEQSTNANSHAGVLVYSTTLGLDPVLSDGTGNTVDLRHAASMPSGIHAFRFDTAQSTTTDKVRYYKDSTYQSPTGDFSVGTTSNTSYAANAWYLGFRGEGTVYYSPLNMVSFAIYEAAKSDLAITNISNALSGVGSSNTEITPPAGSISFSSVAPTVAASGTYIVPDSVQLAFSSVAPAIGQTGFVTIAPSPGAISLSGKIPNSQDSGNPTGPGSSYSTAGFANPPYSGGGTVAGSNADWYKVAVASSIDLTVSLNGTSFDTYLLLYNSLGDIVQYNDDFGGGGGYSQLTYTAAPDTYYFSIFGYSASNVFGPGFTVTPTSQATGPYTLAVTSAPASPAPSPGTPTTPNAGTAIVKLHMEGSNGGTTFTESVSGLTVTRTGTVVTSTTQAKFGSASGKFDRVTTGTANHLSVPLTSVTSDFTVAAWVWWDRSSGGSGNGYEHCVFSLSPYDLHVYVQEAGTVAAFITSAGVDIITGSSPISSSQWHLITLERLSNTLHLSVDGVLQGSGFTVSGSLALDAIVIGSRINGSSRPFGGYIDEVFVQYGTAYFGGGAFNPPNTAF